MRHARPCSVLLACRRTTRPVRSPLVSCLRRRPFTMPRPAPCPHPFPPKLNFVLAEEVRRLRRAGMSVTQIAERYGVAKSSISAVLKLHTYAPPEVIAVGLEP